jgi:hypothetical protein
MRGLSRGQLIFLVYFSSLTIIVFFGILYKMAKIILKNKEYSLYDFDNEIEFEKAVIGNQKFLFGKDSIYLDVKKRIGKSNLRGIPVYLGSCIWGQTLKCEKIVQ